MITMAKRCVMEVAKHMGHNIVRCIMLSASEGLCRDMEVIADRMQVSQFRSERRPLVVCSTYLERLLDGEGEIYRFRKMVYPSEIRLHLKIRARS